MIPLREHDPSAPEIAPEIEYAVADGFGLEFELPFDEHGLERLKFAGQWTVGANVDAGFIHGIQAVVERHLDEHVWDLSLVYIPAWRFDETWSLLAMAGVGRLTGSDVEEDVGGIGNATLFADVEEDWVLGFEIDSVLFADAGDSVLLMPQAHYDLSEHFQIQFGIGVLYMDGRSIAGTELLVPDTHGWYPQVELRTVVEF